MRRDRPSICAIAGGSAKPLAGFVFGLRLVQKGDLLVFKITKQQRGFELGHET
jgi:hypothetical protein